jgi:hypothetical protein
MCLKQLSRALSGNYSKTQTNILQERGYTMSLLSKIISIAATLTITVIPAFAVTEGRDHPSDYLVWGFLGCCALIIIAQILPVIRNLRKQTKLASDQAKAPEQFQP